MSSILMGRPHGLLWAFRFRESGAEEIFEEPLPSDLRSEGGWIWAHFPLSDQRSRSFLSQLSDAPQEARDLLLGPDCAPRILVKGDWTWGVLPDFEREFDGRFVAFGRLRFAFDETRFVTARRRSLLVTSHIRRQIGEGATLARPRDAFAALTRTYCEIVEDQLDGFAAKLSEIEDQMLSGRASLERLELAPLRRELSRRHREISQLRTACHRAASRQLQSQAHPLAPQLSLLAQQARMWTARSPRCRSARGWSMKRSTRAWPAQRTARCAR